MAGEATSAVTLWWFPVGIEHRLSAITSRLWERRVARGEGRMPVPLHHAALEVHDGEMRRVIEMAPAWGEGSRGRGIVLTGPVHGLGRWGVRYEVRCAEGAMDVSRAGVASGRESLPLDGSAVRHLEERITTTPPMPWGSRPPGCVEMWNSNAFVAWLLSPFLPDVAALRPPPPGRAPGWNTGLVLAG